VSPPTETASRPRTLLARWYQAHGRHGLPWRHTRDRWEILVAEVMLHQTQVARVTGTWAPFLARFPTPAATAGASLGDVLRAWGRLGYPRRARWLWLAARRVTDAGWPTDLTTLPGVGRYTAAAVVVQADDADLPAVEVNIRRTLERFEGRRLPTREAEAAMVRVARPLRGRDRLLALMDLGALVCRPRRPHCAACPLRRRCRTRGPLDPDSTRRAAPFEGSLRQRRGQVLARLRTEGSVPVAGLDPDAVAGLEADGLVARDGSRVRLPG